MKNSNTVKIQMKKVIVSMLILTLVAFQSIAQTKATTEDGKKVILNQDGTWKYDDSKEVKDTVSFACSDLIATETDKMTGKTSVASKNTLIISEDGGKTGFGFFLMKGANSIIFSIQAVGAGSCIDDENKMNVLFKDGTRLTLQNDGKFNCDAKFTLYFGGSFGKKKQLEMFRTKEVETIRIWTSKSYVEKDFSAEQSKQLKQTVNCLINN